MKLIKSFFALVLGIILFVSSSLINNVYGSGDDDGGGAYEGHPARGGAYEGHPARGDRSVDEDSSGGGSIFHIIPEAGTGEGSKPEKYVKGVTKDSKNVWSGYHDQKSKIEEKYSGINKLGMMMATGIMDFDTVIDFAAHLVNFLSQLGLVIGAAMIIYSGYLYSVGIFTGQSTQGSDPIKKAIIGVLIIIFAYAIMRILTLMFLA